MVTPDGTFGGVATVALVRWAKKKLPDCERVPGGRRTTSYGSGSKVSPAGLETSYQNILFDKRSVSGKKAGSMLLPRLGFPAGTIRAVV